MGRARGVGKLSVGPGGSFDLFHQSPTRMGRYESPTGDEGNYQNLSRKREAMTQNPKMEGSSIARAVCEGDLGHEYRNDTTFTWTRHLLLLQLLLGSSDGRSWCDG